MAKHGLIIKYDDVAAMLANEDDDTQSSFFNTFAKELRSACGTNHHAEMQMCFIQGKMKKEAVELLGWDVV
jgi:hypothetical protein